MLVKLCASRRGDRATLTLEVLCNERNAIEVLMALL